MTSGGPVEAKPPHFSKVVYTPALPSYITLTNLSSAILLRKSSFESLQGDTVPAKVDNTEAVFHFTVICTINDAYNSYTAEGKSQYLHVLARVNFI